MVVMEEELGVPWEDVFESVDSTPLAAGTIAQVHRATLESGERVVIKVQRPTARSDIMKDLALLELFAEKTERRPLFHQVVDMKAVFTHLSESLQRELDFKQEAGNIERMRGILERLPEARCTRRLPRHLDEPAAGDGRDAGSAVHDAPQGTARREAARQLLRVLTTSRS